MFLECMKHGFESWIRRSPGKGNGYPLQYSCLGNPLDTGTWWGAVHGVEIVRHDLATKPPPILPINHTKGQLEEVQLQMSGVQRKEV